MKKILAIVAMLVVMASSVMATFTTLTPDSINMGYSDAQVAQFCIYSTSVNGTPIGPLNVNVVLGTVCRDVDSLVGCSAADTLNPAGFTVVPQDATTGADGCVNLNLATALSPGQEGLFYYTVNGQVAGTTVGSETGQVFVPEFGVVAAGTALVGAGAYIARKRKN